MSARRTPAFFPPASLHSAVSTLVLLLALICSPLSATAAEGGTARHSIEQEMRLGEAMFRRGILPSGKPMKATVQRDIAVTGKMIPCSSCHMRSGLGSFEGGVITLPTNGDALFRPRKTLQDIPISGKIHGLLDYYKRPSYTDASLARALRTGIDPAGRIMSRSMPRYALDDADMAIMIGYLKRLSSGTSPGVTGKTIRLATVVAEGVSNKDRNAMLAPLRAFIRQEWNGNLPVIAVTYRDKRFRSVELDVWELKGPPGTWKEQLEAHYARRPVFALVGGMAPGGWGPIHEFCEGNRLPCILPMTDLPAVAGRDWYTIYFSKGYYQEGEAAAKYLARVHNLSPEKELVQVFRDDPRGRALAAGCATAWKGLGTATVRERIVPEGAKADADFWRGLAAEHKGAAILAWLGPEDISGIGAFADGPDRPSAVFVSSTMLGGKISSVPESIRGITFVTYPKRLPREADTASPIVKQWLKVRKIHQTDFAINSKVYFLTRMLAKVLADMRGNAYRDYFLDLFDMIEEQSAVAPGYPRLSFGPGQRYASKGCYVVSLTKGKKPGVVAKSDWVVY